MVTGLNIRGKGRLRLIRRTFRAFAIEDKGQLPVPGGISFNKAT